MIICADGANRWKRLPLSPGSGLPESRTIRYARHVCYAGVLLALYRSFVRSGGRPDFYVPAPVIRHIGARGRVGGLLDGAVELIPKIGEIL